MKPKGPPGETGKAVGELLDRGVPRNEVAKRLGISRSTVTYHARRRGFGADPRFSREYHWEAVQRVYDRGLSLRQCKQRFGFSSAAWYSAVERGVIVSRGRELIPLSDLLVSGRSTARKHLKDRLYDAGLKREACERCGISDWRDEKLSLQLHHINGQGEANRLENLEILCPNCHAQTDTWGGRNKRHADSRAA